MGPVASIVECSASFAFSAINKIAPDPSLAKRITQIIRNFIKLADELDKTKEHYPELARDSKGLVRIIHLYSFSKTVFSLLFFDHRLIDKKALKVSLKQSQNNNVLSEKQIDLIIKQAITSIENKKYVSRHSLLMNFKVVLRQQLIDFGQWNDTGATSFVEKNVQIAKSNASPLLAACQSISAACFIGAGFEGSLVILHEWQFIDLAKLANNLAKLASNIGTHIKIFNFAVDLVSVPKGAAELIDYLGMSSTILACVGGSFSLAIALYKVGADIHAIMGNQNQDNWNKAKEDMWYCTISVVEMVAGTAAFLGVGTVGCIGLAIIANGMGIVSILAKS